MEESNEITTTLEDLREVLASRSREDQPEDFPSIVEDDILNEIPIAFVTSPGLKISVRYSLPNGDTVRIKVMHERFSEPLHLIYALSYGPACQFVRLQ